MADDTRNMLQPAAIGGAALGVVSQIPIINCACCVWALGGGVLAAFLYFRNLPPARETPYGDGAVLGLMTGGIGAMISSILSIPFLLLGMIGGGSEQIERALENFDLPDEVAGWIGSAGFSVGALLIGFGFNLIIFAIFALIGGLIGAAVFQNKA